MTARTMRPLRSFSFLVRGPESVTEALEALVGTGALYADRDEEGLPRAVRHESFELFVSASDVSGAGAQRSGVLDRADRAVGREEAKRDFLALLVDEWSNLQHAVSLDVRATTARLQGVGSAAEALDECISDAKRERSEAWDRVQAGLEKLVRELA